MEVWRARLPPEIESMPTAGCRRNFPQEIQKFGSPFLRLEGISLANSPAPCYDDLRKSAEVFFCAQTHF